MIKKFKVTQKLIAALQYQINDHFGLNIKAPKVIIVKSPQIFFDYYTGIKKKRDINTLIKLDSEVSYFYDDETKKVFFKGFKRSGSKEFSPLDKISIQADELFHEFIHHAQIMTGGYCGELLNLFDEGCCETVSYVVSGNIDYSGVYFDYIKILWTLLDSITTNREKKYNIIKNFNTFEDKNQYANTILKQFLSKNKKVATTKNQFLKMVEGLSIASPQFQNFCDTYSSKEIVDDLFKLHDRFRKNLIPIFQ